MNLKKTFGVVSGPDLKQNIVDKSKGIRNFNLYMKKGPAAVIEKNSVTKNKSLSINDKFNYNGKLLNESTNKYKPLETRNDNLKPNPTETSFTNNNIDIKISVNYLKQNHNNNSAYKDISHIKDEASNASLSNILMKDLQNKETMLKNLKSSISEDKNIRKKIYNTNEKELNNISIMPHNEFKPIHKRNPTSNQEIIQNNLNISLLTYENKAALQNLYNNSTTNKMLHTTQNDIPSHQSFFTSYKPTPSVLEGSNMLRNSYTLNNLHKDKINESASHLSTNMEHNLQSSMSNLNNVEINNGGGSTGGQILKEAASTRKVTFDKETISKLYNLEKKIEDFSSNCSTGTTSSDITSLANRFSGYKKLFEEYNSIMVGSEGYTVPNKIAAGYNEIVKSMLLQHSNILEKLSSYGNISKKLSETNKLIEDKNNEILHLRAKLNEVEQKKKARNVSYSVDTNIKFCLKSSHKYPHNPSESQNSICNNNYIGPAKQTDCNQNGKSSNVVSNNNQPHQSRNNQGIEAANSFVLPIETSEHNKIISELNMNMIEDLEALYLPDKVHMRSNSANMKKIPKLNFHVVDERMTKNTQADQVNNNVLVNMNQLNKLEEPKKNLKELKLKGLENINKEVLSKIENTKNQLNMSYLNNYSTKNNPINVINYHNK